ncbi:MAG: 30S ribosomal protein S17 [Candidatus Spechtbacterales bacterium]
MNAQNNETTKRRMKGTVASNKMEKTLVVEVKRLVVHPLYKKRRSISKRYKAHYDEGTYDIGMNVEIEETKPISKEVRWRVVTPATKDNAQV